MERTFATKQDINKFAEGYGCSTRYVGEGRVMYINGARAEECIERIHEMGFVVPYTLKVELSPKEAFQVSK